MPRYAGGVLFYGDKGVLRAVRFDLDRLDLIGEPVPLPYDPITKESGAVDYDVAPDGTLVFRPGGAQASRLNLAWVGGTGAVTPVKVETRPYRGLRVSPDGRQVAVTLETELDLSLWLVDLDRRTVTRLTPPGYSVMSSGASYGWRPDGRALAVPLWHLDPAANPPGLFLVSSTGTAPPRRLTQPPSGVRHTSVAWSQDGGTLLFTHVESDRPHLMRMTIGGEIEPVLAGAAAPALSPDGRWLAYVSDESGPRDIYVRPYPNVDDDRVVISAGGGTLPTWTRDGRELLYISLDRHLTAVKVSPGAGRPFGAPERRMALESETFTYGISPDGTRVLTTVRPERTGGVPNEFRVVFNLLAEVKPLLK